MLLTIQGGSFDFGNNLIFEDVNLTLNEGDKVGLIGDNGVGKTTLLNIILQNLQLTCGELIEKSNLSVGYLAQNTGLDKDIKVYDEMLLVFSDVIEAQKTIAEVSEKLAITDYNSEEYKNLIQKFEFLTNKINAKDGYNIEVKIKTVLNGMGFSEKYSQVISTMSGGEKTRLAICKLLLEAPELLILDEPTNHLDFNTLLFLEDYLSGYKGGILIVSHDRYFLDKMVNRIWELADKNIEAFRGNYSKYKILKKELVEFRLKEYEKQQEKITAMKEYAEKNIVRATTSKSAKSRLHQLENIEVLKKPILKHKNAKFKFDMTNESVKDVLKVENLNLYAENTRLLDAVSFDVTRGERVAIIGNNGTGKSTLIKKLLQEESENIRFGKGVKIAYYDQENLNLNFENTVLEELWGRYHLQSQTYIRTLLGNVLLTEEDIHKKVCVLSGGERAKLGLTIIMAEKGNTLLLDEPTNHLDLQTREALETALNNFKGTIIFVSHDRYFLNSLATKIIEIKNKQLNIFEGNYDSYLKILNENTDKNISKNNNKNLKDIALFKKGQKEVIKISEGCDRKKDEIRRKNQKIVEEKIINLEAKEEGLLKEISLKEVAENFSLLNEKCLLLEQIKKDLEVLYDNYETLLD